MQSHRTDQKGNRQSSEIQKDTREDTGVTVKIFELADTHGFPLEMSALELRERGLLPDWEDFFMGACKAKWKRRRIQRGLEEIAGVFGWLKDPVFMERAGKMWELAIMRTGWTESSWLAGRKTPMIIEVQND